MRHISFAQTKAQILARRKFVTRRLGWEWLVAACARGERPLLSGIEKGRGLKRGEKVKPLSVIRVLDARREPLRRLTDDVDYGLREIELEGFGDDENLKWPSVWVPWFCAGHRGCTPDSTITRIHFDYLEAEA